MHDDVIKWKHFRGTGPFAETDKASFGLQTVRSLLTIWLISSEIINILCHKCNGHVYIVSVPHGTERTVFVVILFKKYSRQWRDFGEQVEAFFALRALCAGNSPMSGELPTQSPVTRSFDVFLDLRLNKSLSNNRDTGNLRHRRAHYDVTVMCERCIVIMLSWDTNPALWCIYKNSIHSLARLISIA